ncbi:MAG: AI-2E family transporter [Magnetococcales bacterium]|nr:AI-2E family transporter [Magnetococcales bacterium]
MSTDAKKPAPFEEGFLALLLVLATVGLVWLFMPFLPGLFLAVLLASSTYPLYVKLQERFQLFSDAAAMIMTVLVFFLVVSPLVYLLASTGLRMGQAVHELQMWLTSLGDAEGVKEALRVRVDALPLPEGVRAVLLDELSHNKGQMAKRAAEFVVTMFRSVTGNSFGFLSALLLTLFALFFFYRDGPKILHRIKVLTPLENAYDDILFNRFRALATVLTLSTFGIALVQGLSFSLVTAFMGLPWFYLGVAIAVASFIPVVGGVVVWGPLAYSLYLDGRPGGALFIVVWGALVVGFVIDNLLRPVLISWLADITRSGSGGDERLHALSHTLLTVLATFGGMVSFGILGLFFGPMIAAMAISVFDVYEMIHGEGLDQS